jgi:serine/threonine protein kinase
MLVDLWSAGCIFVEMLLHSTVPFFPGINHVNLIESIIDIVGAPSPNFLEKFPPSKVCNCVASTNVAR